MRFLLLLPCLLFFLALDAQNGTSLEEYRYLTKGYAYQKGLGLDATKDGYTFKELFTSKDGIEFVGMYHTGTESPQAILCVFDKGIEDNSFICLPNNSSTPDILALARQDRNSKLNYEKRQQLDRGLIELLFHQMGHLPTPEDALVANTSIPKEYNAPEEFTPKGVPSSQPMVASANSAPSYPTNQPATYSKPDMVQTGNIWDSLPIASSSPNSTNQQNKATAPTSNDAATVSTAPDKTSLNMTIGLENRAIVSQPAVVTSTKKTGVIVIKLCVNQHGEVISSKFTQRGSSTLDAHLREVAQANAAQILFQPSHLTEQCGTLTYYFNKEVNKN